MAEVISLIVSIEERQVCGKAIHDLTPHVASERGRPIRTTIVLYDIGWLADVYAEHRRLYPEHSQPGGSP